MQAFAYSVGVSEAMHGSSEQYRPTDPLEMTVLQWHIFKMQHVAMGWKFKVCYFDFCYFKWGSSPSFRGKKQTNKSCASLSDSKCSCGEWAKAERSGPDLQHCCHQKAEHCLSCSYCTRSDLIGSRLDLYMDLETPKVWLFTSWVLAIGLKAEELERRDSSARREWQDQDLKKEWQIEAFIPSWPTVGSVVVLCHVYNPSCVAVPLAVLLRAVPGAAHGVPRAPSSGGGAPLPCGCWWHWRCGCCSCA